jgi:hypothetical protein
MPAKAWSGKRDRTNARHGEQKASFWGDVNVRNEMAKNPYLKGVFKRSSFAAHFAHIETYVRMCRSADEDFSSHPHMCGNVQMCGLRRGVAVR